MKMKMKMKMITAPILGFLAIFGMLLPSCMANQYRNYLKSGESLEASEFLSSGDFLFMMRPNCNLALFRNSTAVWSTGTGGKDYSCSAKFHRGGNLVVYTPKGVSLWESSFGTGGPEYVLALQKDGNVVMYGDARWSVNWPKENPVPDQWLVDPEPTNILYPGESLKADESLILGSFKCTMQADCNFVCRNGTETVWATNTTGKGSGCYFKLESQGKLVLYDSANSRLWGTASYAYGNYLLLIQKSPILAVHGPQLWSTKPDWIGLTSNSTAQFSNRKIAKVMSQ